MSEVRKILLHNLILAQDDDGTHPVPSRPEKSKECVGGQIQRAYYTNKQGVEEKKKKVEFRMQVFSELVVGIFIFFSYEAKIHLTTG